MLMLLLRSILGSCYNSKASLSALHMCLYTVLRTPTSFSGALAIRPFLGSTTSNFAATSKHLYRLKRPQLRRMVVSAPSGDTRNEGLSRVALEKGKCGHRMHTQVQRCMQAHSISCTLLDARYCVPPPPNSHTAQAVMYDGLRRLQWYTKDGGFVPLQCILQARLFIEICRPI